MLSKIDLRVQMDAKSGPLKMKVRVKFSAHLVMHKRMQVVPEHLQGALKNAQRKCILSRADDPLDSAIKGCT